MMWVLEIESSRRESGCPGRSRCSAGIVWRTWGCHEWLMRTCLRIRVELDTPMTVVEDLGGWMACVG